MFELLPESISSSPSPQFPPFRAQVLCVDARQIVQGGVGGFARAFGCDDGSLVFSMESREHRIQLDGPISCVCLFSTAAVPRAVGRSPRQSLWADRPLINWTSDSLPGTIDWGGMSSASDVASKALSKFRAATAKSLPSEMLLGCGGAAGFVTVFENVAQHGLDRIKVLAQNEDAMLSMAAADFDCDGQEELLVGTFGGQLIVYGRHCQGEGVDEKMEWMEKSRVDFGVPLHSFHVLRSVDVVPYVLCGTPVSLDVLGPPLRCLEAILQSKLDAIAQKYSV